MGGTNMPGLRKLFEAVGAFAADRRGNLAFIYALALVPLIIASGAAIDYGRGVFVRASLTRALDAAGLAVGSSGTLSQSDSTAKAQAFFNANYRLDTSYGTPSPVAVVQNGQDFTLTASVPMPTALLHFAGIDTMPVATSVVVTRNSMNIEVALALDITGSMASGTRLADLKTAAEDLIDMVVQDVQSPTYSKVALVPYSMAVNAGSYATQVRGAITAGKAITGATRANPVVITAPGHGFANGDTIYVTSVSGMTNLNNKPFTVTNATTNTFALYGVNGTAYTAYTGGGTAWCTTPGCQYYNFTSAASTTNTFQVSTCVTERTTDAYNDNPPSTTALGRNYPSAATNPCLGATIVPLSTDKTALKSLVDGYAATGSTAGHIGIAWAWYMLSPNFGTLWSSDAQPGSYASTTLLKFAVIMTDGAFNTPYCKGVIAQDATTGSDDPKYHNSCNAPGGSSIAQAKLLCAAMKTKGIIIYTVGFDVGSDASAIDVLTSCASDSAHAYFPATGSDLKDAFHDIAQQITNLRVKS
jgi:Flp pilus assembly protein TadG